VRSILLIAWREYKQYVLSRGFLIFLISFPLLIGLGGAAMTFLETSRPIRHFVVFDEAGGYVEAIDREIESRFEMSVISAWDAYASVAIDKTKVSPEDLPEPFAPAAITRTRQGAFFAAGGVDAARAAIKDYLKAGAPLFVGPKRQFERLDLSGVVSADATIEEAAEILRPFLLGEKTYPKRAHGLFAAIFIPKAYTGRDDGEEAQYWSANLTDPALEITVSRALTSTARRQLSANFGLAPGQLDAIADLDAPMQAFRPDKNEGGGALEDVDRVRSAFVPAAMTYMLLVVIFGVGNLLLTNTIEERSNKID